MYKFELRQKMKWIRIVLAEGFLIFYLWVMPGVFRWKVLCFIVFAHLLLLLYLKRRKSSRNVELAQATVNPVGTSKYVSEFLSAAVILLMWCSPWSHTELLEAASAGGHNGVIELLLKIGTDVNSSHSEYSPLMLASMFGNKSTVDLLLKHGANVSLRNPRGTTAISAAESKGHIDIIELLKEAGEKE
jgi:hypothetical protein